MTKTHSAAEAITAIIFDPIKAKPAKHNVLGVLWGQKPEPVATAAPRYRTLAEARNELTARGVDDSVISYFVRGLGDLHYEAVVKLEREVEGFSRRTSVSWDNENAYLGIGFKHPQMNDIATQRPDLVSDMRRDFLRHITTVLDSTARTSLPAEKVAHAAHLAYA